MNAPLVSCGRCRSPLPGNLFNLPDPVHCPGCGSVTLVEVFPALYRSISPGKRGETILEQSESSCFYHPEKKAVVPCDSCGRFLCALCDCELNGQHLCPGCVDTGRKKGKIQDLENHRVLYDSTALTLTVVPMVVCYPFLPFSLFTAPIALYLAIRHWKTPTSVVRRTKARFVMAIVLASLQILGWILVIPLVRYFNHHN